MRSLRDMRILCITPYYKPAYVYGGPTRSNSELCEALVKLGAEVTVLTTNANGKKTLDVPLGVPIIVDGVEVYYYPTLPIFPHSFFYSPALARACYQKAVQYDVAFLDTIFSHAMGPGVAACKQANVPYIITLRSALLPWGLRHKKLKKDLYLFLVGDTYFNHAAALHCTAPIEALALQKLGLRPPSFVVPNGIDTDQYNNLPPRGAMRQVLNIPEQANVLLFLGRLHVKKRPDIAIEALASSQSLPGETHLILAGPDEMQLIPKLQDKAGVLGCLESASYNRYAQGGGYFICIGKLGSISDAIGAGIGKFWHVSTGGDGCRGSNSCFRGCPSGSMGRRGGGRSVSAMQN